MFQINQVFAGEYQHYFEVFLKESNTNVPAFLSKSYRTKGSFIDPVIFLKTYLIFTKHFPF